MITEALRRGPIVVSKSAIHGYGVFATEDIAEGSIVEECYTLLSSSSDIELGNYYFNFMKNKISALPLGYGCIYNHSTTPHIDSTYSHEGRLLTFTAIRPIKKGEEIYSSYGDSWFSSRNLKMKSQPWWRQLYRFSKKPLRAAIIICLLYGSIYALKYLSL